MRLLLAGGLLLISSLLVVETVKRWNNPPVLLALTGTGAALTLAATALSTEQKPLPIDETADTGTAIAQEEELVLPEGDNPVEQKASAIIERLASADILSDYAGSKIGPSFAIIQLKPRAKYVKKLLAAKDEIQLAVESNVPPTIRIKNGSVEVGIPRPDREYVYFRDWIKPQQVPSSEPIKLAVGIDIDGKLVEIDYSKNGMSSALITGTTGGGKSVALLSMIASAMLRYSPDRVQFLFIDCNRSTFTELQGCAHSWQRLPVATTEETAIEYLTQLLKEQDRRAVEFEKVGAKNLSEYNCKAAKSLPRIFACIEELSKLTSDKEIKTQLELLIKQIAEAGRKYGCHLLVATQYATREVVSRVISVNLPIRLGFLANDAVASKVAVDDIGCESLLADGDCFLRLPGKPVERLQALYLEEGELDQWIIKGPVSQIQQPNFRQTLERIWQVDIPEQLPQPKTEAEIFEQIKSLRSAGQSKTQIISQIFSNNGDKFKEFSNSYHEIVSAHCEEWVAELLEIGQEPIKVIEIVWSIKSSDIRFGKLMSFVKQVQEVYGL